MTQPKNRKRDLTFLAFAIVYIIVGVVLFYLEFSGTISTAVFGIGLIVLLAGSLTFKLVTEYLRRRRIRSL
jgi:uncharacterized membrane protein HdeD (DUF308 family)